MLEHILSDLITQANQHPRKFVMRKLNNGLFVYLKWEEPFYTMTISRDKFRPGPIEMATCIRYLPATVEKPNKSDILETTFNNRQSLRVDFAKAEYVQSMFRTDEEQIQDLADHG